MSSPETVSADPSLDSAGISRGHAAPARRLERVLALGIAALIVAIGALALRSRDTDSLTQEIAKHHAVTAQVPWERFLIDRANSLEGRIVDGAGKPLAGVPVRVDSLDELRRSSAACPLDAWPEPTPEARTTSGPDGRYLVRGLTYGAKRVLAGGPDHGLGEVSEVLHSDGYASTDLDFVLRRREDLTVPVIHDAGRPQANESVRLMPRVFGVAEMRTQTDAQGRLTIPGWLVTARGRPQAWLGEPGMLVDLDADEQRITVPDRRTLRVRVDGASNSELRLSWIATRDRRTFVTRTFQPGDFDAIELPSIPCTGGEIRIAQDDRIASASFVHDGSERRIVLSSREPLRVLVCDSGGRGVVATLTMRASPFPVHETAEIEPFGEWGGHDGQVSVRSDASGNALFTPRTLASGHLLVEGDGYSPAIVEFDVSDRERTVVLSAARRVSVRTLRPYRIVRVETAEGLAQLGRADACAEASAWVAPGPVIARGGLGDGTFGYPQGTWSDGGGEIIELSRSDEPGRVRGCVYGFVLDARGGPIADATVYLHGSTRIPRETPSDPRGFYRFTDVPAGPHVVVARRKDDFDALRCPQATLVPSGTDDDGAFGVRLDLTLWRGEIRVEGRVSPIDGEVALRTADGVIVWSKRPRGNEAVRITAVPPGEYEVVDLGAVPERRLGLFELVRDPVGPIVVDW